MGFADRSDSFDLNVALQDHFKGIKRDIEIAKENDITSSSNGLSQASGPKLDLAFKEGQTIRINIPKSEKTTRDKNTKKGATGPLPPPPGGIGRIAPPPSISNLTPLQSPTEPVSSVIGKMEIILCAVRAYRINKRVSNHIYQLIIHFLGTTKPANNPPSVSSNIDLLGDLTISAPPPIQQTPVSSSSTAKTEQKTSDLLSSFDDPWGDFASAPTSNASSGNWTTF